MKRKHRPYKVAVVGLGYVGLPLAMLCVTKGLHVIGIDIDSKKLQDLEQGRSYLSDITDREIQQFTRHSHFSWTDQFKVLEQVDACILCVPTPLRDHTYPDLSYLQTAADSISPYMKQGRVVILESSTFPGTTEEVLLPILSKNGAIVGKDFYLGYSPERIDPGNEAYKLEDIPKIVSGYTASCLEKVIEFYSRIFHQLVPVSSPQVAELTKLLENCQRFINISFMNEMLVICHEMNIDLWEAIEAAKTKPYGFTAYYPGPGVGGHCIPVDPLYLQWKAKQYNLDTKFIKLSKAINDQMPSYILDRLRSLLSQNGGLNSTNVLVIGLTYKKDVNDIRESTAMMITEELIKRGAKIAYHDPLIPQVSLAGSPLHSIELQAETIKTFDCVLILTDHSAIPYELLLEHAKLILDTRNIYKQKHPSVVTL